MQMSEQPQECKIEHFSSRVCERGTKSCTVYHSEQPQEWTRETLSKFVHDMGWDVAAAQINAALAAEREKVQRVSGLGADAYNKLYEQLTAERKTTEAVRNFWKDTYDTCYATLAAERERVRTLMELCNEVAAGHRDKNSPEYNECENAPCAWCDALAKMSEQWDF
jgi:phosphoglycolate phosphatase-like HAD superfamily hydrolase